MKISKKTFKVLLSIIIILAVFLSGFSFGSLSTKLDKIQYMIKHYFPMDYSADLMVDSAAKSMVSSLGDQFSEYYTKEEYSALEDYINASYKGVGISLFPDPDKNVITVYSVTPNSPADLAGLKAGDILVSVDSIKADISSYDDLVYYVRGISENAVPDDVPMKFTVIRDNKTLLFDITRSSVTIETVYEKEVDENIYYIKLSEFALNSADEFKTAIKNAKDYPALILDLRNNGGGLSTTLKDIASEILPEGLLYYALGSNGKRTDEIIKDNDFCDIPLVVLVNENSASASEILTGAIIDYGRGTVIGKTTYGKGLIQGIFPLSDGSGLKLTIARYYTPQGNFINEKGITPDILIESEEEQLRYAINYIKENILK